MQRFEHFVNSKLHDDNVIFTTERKQIRPASALEKKADIAVEIL